MSVQLVITDGPEFDPITYVSGMTAKDLLEASYNSLIPNPPAAVTEFAYGLEFYGSEPTYPAGDPLGYLVCMINGTTDSANAAQAPYFFWEFSVNDTPATRGIDYTTLADGDEVKFAFTQYIPAVTKSKILNAKYQRILAFHNK